MKVFKDFAKFINKGNVIDMAVGVVVGGAFGKIVTSLVADIITPCITYITGGAKNAGKAILKVAELAEDGSVVSPEIAINYGNFIQTIIDFLIIAFCIFVVVRFITKTREKLESLKKKEEESAPAPAPAEPSPEEKLLTEIRDLLKEGK